VISLVCKALAASQNRSQLIIEFSSCQDIFGFPLPVHGIRDAAPGRFAPHSFPLHPHPGDDRSSLPPVYQVPRFWIAPDSGCVKALPRVCLFSRPLDGVEKPAEKTAAGEP